MSKDDSIFVFPDNTPPPAERTAQDWVDFYLECESAAAEGKQVRFDDGRYMSSEDLDKIIEARQGWERRVNIENRRRSGGATLGGFTVKKADLSR